MIWNLITGGLAGAIKGVTELGSLWMKGKHAKQEMKMAVALKVATGEIDYNVAAQQGMQSSWKDEFLTVFTCGWLVACFIPSLQPTMEAGFVFLGESAPDWFSYIIVGMYVAIYGLKGWKIFANK